VCLHFGSRISEWACLSRRHGKAPARFNGVLGITAAPSKHKLSATRRQKYGCCMGRGTGAAHTNVEITTRAAAASSSAVSPRVRSSEHTPGVIMRSERNGATTPDGGMAAVPWRVTVGGRQLSARNARTLTYHIPEEQLTGLDIHVEDRPGEKPFAALANEAMIGEWLKEHLAAPAPAPADRDASSEHQELLDRLIRLGSVDPNCATCANSIIPAVKTTGQVPFQPSHRASPMCRSGRRPHCTCDACW
jgi:hypothetical protein